jgi:RHS repeat-associated protein
MPLYTFTNQASYMDDPLTSGVTEGFGLMFYQSRWYDPYLNHFSQPDSIVPDPGNSQDWDRYSYARNNPIRYNDPSGHEPGNCYDRGYCRDKRDMSQWIVAATVDAAESIEMKMIKLENKAGGKAVAYASFVGLVSDGKKYDVKDKIKTEVGRTVKIGSKWFEWSTTGNILYGFYGLAAGFTKGELHAGAGLAQIKDHYANPDESPIGDASTYYDTSDDYYAIEFGFYLYENYYAVNGELTEADLLDALNTFSDVDKMALREAPKTFYPKWDKYDVDQFYY